MNTHYTCLLCLQSGEHLVPSGYQPNLFALQEHLVSDHSIPWEYLLLSLVQPVTAGQDEGATEWSLPPERAVTCSLPQERYLRAAHGTTTLFYFAATFPSRESSLQAEMEIIDQCKRSHPNSLAGGAGELENKPVVMFVDLLPEHEPDRLLQLRIWSAIHLYQGKCVALPAAIVASVADTLGDELSARQQAHPEANWVEIDYTSGKAFYDVPTRSARRADDE